MLIYEKATSATAYMAKNIIQEALKRHQSKNREKIDSISVNSQIKKDIKKFLEEPIVENKYKFTRPSESPLLHFMISK